MPSEFPVRSQWVVGKNSRAENCASSVISYITSGKGFEILEKIEKFLGNFEEKKFSKNFGHFRYILMIFERIQSIQKWKEKNWNIFGMTLKKFWSNFRIYLTNTRRNYLETRKKY